MANSGDSGWEWGGRELLTADTRSRHAHPLATLIKDTQRRKILSTFQRGSLLESRCAKTTTHYRSTSVTSFYRRKNLLNASSRFYNEFSGSFEASTTATEKFSDTACVLACKRANIQLLLSLSWKLPTWHVCSYMYVVSKINFSQLDDVKSCESVTDVSPIVTSLFWRDSFIALYVWFREISLIFLIRSSEASKRFLLKTISFAKIEFFEVLWPLLLLNHTVWVYMYVAYFVYDNAVTINHDRNTETNICSHVHCKMYNLRAVLCRHVL